jgi:molecular chaperone DnaK
MAKRCGIDLGTTYSSISCYDGTNQRVVTVPLGTMADGQPIIRSVVYYPGNNQPPVVGDTAWNAARQFPERVVVGIKRSMGTSFKVAIDGVEYSPQQVSAEILKVLVKEAESYLREQVTGVVITVPAYFRDDERAATLEAGKLAGLNVLGLLPEPHAAVLAVVSSGIVEKDLLVCDLGGGSFNVTLIHATAEACNGIAVNLNLEILLVDGNANLGGLDWDRALADMVAEKVAQRYGVDIRLDPKNEPSLLDNCEKAKRDFSRVENYSIIADMAGHAVEVSVEEFEYCTQPLLLETQLLLEKVLEDAQSRYGLPKERIEVMLTGGASKMPMVAKMVERVMGKSPIRHQNPGSLVRIGAAYWAHLVQHW